MSTTNFAEHVTLMSEEAPRALALDWWRRLDLMIDDYFAARGLTRPKAPHVTEAMIASDPRLGGSLSVEITVLRRCRNELSHGPFVSFGPDQAADYATRAFDIIGELASVI